MEKLKRCKWCGKPHNPHRYKKIFTPMDICPECEEKERPWRPWNEK